MYAFRTSHGPADLAFTDRYGGVSASPFEELNLALEGEDSKKSRAENLRIVMDDFGPGDDLRDLRQVHGGDVDVVEESTLADGDRPAADALVAATPGVTLMVRTADCVPVLFVDRQTPIIAAAHCGRPGLTAGVVPRTVAQMQRCGARSIEAWIGPHVCGRCYEVPASLRDEVASVVPESGAETAWGTPSLDLGAAVTAQLRAAGVTVHDVSRCTRESADLYSYRRNGQQAGRQVGLVRLRAA